MASKKNLPDLAITLLLLVVASYYAYAYVDFNIPPFEDAAMLMRYSQNLANGHGIVWNIGERPVDGATDFLFMLSLAGLIKLGFTVGQAVRGIGFASHLLTILIVYWGNRRVHHANIWLSLFSGLYLAVGVGLSYVSAYFGTPYFALATAAAWTLALLLMKEQNPRFGLILAFALSGLIAGLIRPEGVILASLMLLSVIFVRGVKNSIAILATFVLVFGLLGGAYFLWRWDYFGYPLPNPFYKKGNHGLQWSSFYGSLQNTLKLCLPFAFAALLGLRSQAGTRQTIAYLIPILGFASAFILISDEMNYGMRFQYALLPIALLSWIPLLGRFDFSWLNQKSARERGVYSAAIAALFLSLVYYSWFQNCFLVSEQKTCARPYEKDGRYEMAKFLAEYRDRGYVIATTEAGLLPYYSGWTALDTWGLNDQFIAHNGKLTTAYLDQYKPQIIMFHDYYSPLVPPKLTEANLAQPWFSMTILLKTYAEENGYVLAAVFGSSPYDTHYYYVRSDFEDSRLFIKKISEFRNYYDPTTGKRSLNYAKYQEP